MGSYVYLLESHLYLLKSGVVVGTNNIVELMELKMLKLFSMEKGCRALQVFGDSMIVINWVTGAQRCHIIRMEKIILTPFMFVMSIGRTTTWPITDLSMMSKSNPHESIFHNNYNFSFACDIYDSW